MKMMLILPLIVALFFLPVVFAQQQPTQQFNKIFLNPFYRASMTNNQNYSYTLTINPPDKISSVQSAILSFDVYLSPSVTFYLWVNNLSCNNPTYLVSTTYSGAGQARVTFDCSNIINKSGTYHIILKPTQANTGAINGWIDLTYMNNPKGEIKMHGTEYTIGQTAKVWLQLLDAESLPIENGVCLTDIYTPDGEEYIERATMVNMEHDGIFYYDFPTDTLTEGVYPSIALCYYIANQFPNYATSYTLENATLTAGTIQNTWADDAVTLKLKEIASGGIRRLRTDLIFANGSICGNFSEQFLTGVTIYVDAKFDSVANDDITMSVYNHSSGLYVDLPNKLLEGNVFRQVSNTLDFNNITSAGFVNSSGSDFRVKFTDANITDGANDDIELDYVYVSCDALSSPVWQETRGSSEVHINNPLNSSKLAETVWQYNETINPNILNQFSNSIWTMFNSTYNFINLISEAIWTRTDRNLSYYPVQNDLTNYTRISEGVWNETSRTLTYYPTSVNASVNVTGIADAVWNTTYNRTISSADFVNAVDALNALSTTFIGGTEYQPNDNGKIALRLVSGTGKTAIPESGGNCNVTILYPNETKFVDNLAMTEYGIGVYTYNFVVPSVIGTYPYYTNCLGAGLNPNKYYGLDTFHVRIFNETTIAEAVWAGNRTINGSLLTQISDNVWNYVSRYTHGEVLN